MDRLVHYKTHIEILDGDHREIFALVLDIIKFAEQNYVVNDDLVLLQAKIEEHFETEEALMAAIEYPYLEYHKGSHYTLREYLRLITVTTKLMRPTFQLREFLTKFTKHIDEHDMQIYPYIEKSRLKTEA